MAGDLSDSLDDLDDLEDIVEEAEDEPYVPSGRASNSYKASYLKAMDDLGLPPTADPVEEQEWISAHPAMSRQDRAANKTAKVLISKRDVVSPPHGPAPSRRAVNQLQHWANHPKEFQKLKLAEHRAASKKGREQAAVFAPGEVYDDLSKQYHVMQQYAVNKRNAESGK